MSETVTRAITFSVSHVHDGGTWDEFKAMLHELWRCSTEASNWAMQQCARNDNFGEAGGPLPEVSGLVAYKEIVARYPSLGTASSSTLQRAVTRKYRSVRTSVWRGSQSLPFFRYPAPYPIPAAKADLVWVTGPRGAPAPEEGGVPELTVRQIVAKRARQEASGRRPALRFKTGTEATGSLHHWTVELSGGRGFERQLAQFCQILNGEATQGEVAIYQQRCGKTHRNQASGKAPGGASRVEFRVIVKIVAHFPVRPRGPATGTLELRTDPDALWVACHDGRVVSPWVLNADDARQWLARMRDAHADHAARLQRMAQDLKVERRTHVGAYAQHRGKLDAMCDKHRRRVGTFLKQCAAGIVNYCVRRKVHALIYDDTDRSWMPKFPWAMLRTELRHRCEQSGVQAGGTLLLAEE